MSDSKCLIKTINNRIKAGKFISELNVAMASTILACNGIEDAIKYVNELPNSIPPIEAAFDYYIDEVANV